MENKVLVEVYVPVLEEKYAVYIPIGKQLGNIIFLLAKAICEMSDSNFQTTSVLNLYNKDTGRSYALDTFVKDSDIRNGTRLILL